MAINMFDIYYADLSKGPIGSEQGGVRPVIIVQNDIGNFYSPTVIILPITSAIKKINMPTHCLIHKSNKNGLTVDSMVMAEQVRMIDKSRLKEKIGHLDDVNEQNDVIGTYIANVTGKNRKHVLFYKILNMLFKLIKETNNYGSAA